MRLWLGWVAAFLAAAGIAAAQESLQDLEAKKRDLQKKAEAALARGDQATATRFTAEAWAVQADIDWDSLSPACADDSYTEAVRLGWTGDPPWVRRPRKAAQEEQEERPLVPVPEETPILERPARSRYRGQVDTWPFVATAPYHHGRNQTWHSLLNTPSFEEALVPPEGIWHFRVWMEISTSGWTDSSEGGASQWITDFHQENFEINYSVTDRLMFGARLMVGELLEFDGAPLRVFENGRQIVPSEERSFDTDSFVLRAKYVGDIDFGDGGVLVELKLPMGQIESMLSASTIDLGVSGLFTRRWENWIFHANLGFVLPFGNPDVFFEDVDDVNSYLTGALGLSYIYETWLTFGLQLEFNTSAYRDVTILGDPVGTLLFHTRGRAGEGTFLGAGVGHGINELSGDWFGTATLDFTF